MRKIKEWNEYMKIKNDIDIWEENKKMKEYELI